MFVSQCFSNVPNQKTASEIKYCLENQDRKSQTLCIDIKSVAKAESQAKHSPHGAWIINNSKAFSDLVLFLGEESVEQIK